MAKFNGLDKLTAPELRELRGRVDAALIDAEVAEKRELRAKMEALAAEAGFTVAELMSSKRGTKSNRSKGAVAVKYRNPKDPSQTWTGRGRKPNWLSDAVKHGQKIEGFLV